MDYHGYTTCLGIIFFSFCYISHGLKVIPHKKRGSFLCIVYSQDDLILGERKTERSTLHTFYKGINIRTRINIKIGFNIHNGFTVIVEYMIN